MKSSKGFTLIELLAVIVILAIIALIAAPVILNIIDDARKSAAKDSALGVVSSAKLHFAQSLLNTDLAPEFTETRSFTCDGKTCKATVTVNAVAKEITLSIDGTVPTGTLTIDLEGDVNTVTDKELTFGSKYAFTVTDGKVEEKK